MKYIPKYMQKKLVRKVAFQLWRYEVDRQSSEDFERYASMLKSELSKYLKENISSEKYAHILEVYSKLGYIPGYVRLEVFLYKNLLKILIVSIKEDKSDKELDD